MISDDEMLETLEVENRWLRQRLAELERSLEEAQQREQMILEREQRLTFALEGSQDGIWDWNVATGEVYFSSRWMEMLGYQPGELKGHFDTWAQIVHPDDLADTMQLLQPHLDGKLPTFETEHRCRTKDGQWKWILGRGKVIERDQEGQPLRMVGTHTDITQRKQLEEELLAIQSRLWHIIASSPAIIYTCRADGDYGATFISETVIGVFGYTPRQFIADPRFWSDHIHPDDAPRVFADLRHLFEHGHHTHEYRFLHADGSYHWVHDQLRLIRAADGTPVEVIGSWQDITPRKQLEEELRTFKLLVEHSPDGISVADLQGRLTYGNAAFRTMLGYGDEIIGMPISAYIVPEEQEHLQAILPQIFQTGDWQGQLTYLRSTGQTFEGQISAFLVKGEDGRAQAMAGIIRDISQHVQREAELRLINQRLESFLEATPLATIEFGLDGIITRWNQSAERIFGWTTQEALGQELLPLVVPPMEMEQIETIRNTLFDGQIVNSRNDNLTKDGRIITCQWYNTVIYGEHGEVIGVLAQTEDITDQVRQDEIVRANEYLLNTLINTIPIPIFYRNPYGIYMGCNQAFADQVAGKPQAEIIGKSVYDVFEPALASMYIAADAQLLKQGGSQIYESDMYYADGAIHTVIFHKSAFSSSSGNQGGIVGAILDITERKHIEEQLHTFKLLVDNAPAGIAVTTPDRQVSYANRSFRTMCRLGDEIIGMYIPEFHPEAEQATLGTWIAGLENEGWIQGRLRFQRKDASIFTCLTSGFLIKDADGQLRGIGAIHQDITDQLRIEAEHAAFQQQIIAVQQAAIRELSTPLIPIADRVLIMPLIGTIDTQRAQQVMETLLEGVAAHHAETVILDITGVQIVDTQVANALIRAAQAARLLGARVIITGIQPQIAQTLVQLGVDLSSITTRSTLQSGIAAVLALTRR